MKNKFGAKNISGAPGSARKQADVASGPRVVIFDFDGTLADVSDTVRSVYNQMAESRDWPPLTDRDYRRLRKGSITQAIKWAGIRPWQIPGLLREGRRLFKLHTSEINLFPGIGTTIKNLHDSGFRLYVLSSNNEATIRKILRNNRINDRLHILRRPSIFGKHKSINKLVMREGYKRDQVWMVGDELRDIQAAHKAGVESIAVSWGLQDISLLKEARPTFIAKKPADITSFFKKGRAHVR